MKPPIAVTARCEHKNIEPAGAAAPSQTLWASIKVDALGAALERERAPLAVVLVIDVSGSMTGEPIAHVIASAEILADLLGARDQLALVTFSSHAGVRLGLTAMDADGRTQVHRALAAITADGNTNLHGGIEVAAGVLVPAPAGLRRAMVVMSDGQPNVGLSSAPDLARYVGGLKLAVSSLGFGVSHDENVLDAIAVAGSGRYAYIPDPALARLDLARAALAHSGIVADRLELRIEPAGGVELVQVVPPARLRIGAGGAAMEIGDVFVDEGRALAVELAIARAPSSGRLAQIAVSGRAPDGAQVQATATLDVDVRAGARVVDRDAQRDIVFIQADAARIAARAQADRGSTPAAAALLRQVAARIDATEGFVRNDGSLLAELREQLEDEAANYERRSSNLERAHQRKQSVMFKCTSPIYVRDLRVPPAVPAVLVGTSGPVIGQRFELYAVTEIGRGRTNDIVVPSHMLSRTHVRLACLDEQWWLQDLGTTNGTLVNNKSVQSCTLAHGDVIRMGDAEFQFKLL